MMIKRILSPIMTAELVNVPFHRRAAGLPAGCLSCCPHRPIATQVEERFGVALDDSLIPTLPTVGALVDLVTSKKA